MRKLDAICSDNQSVVSFLKQVLGCWLENLKQFNNLFIFLQFLNMYNYQVNEQQIK